MLKEFDMYRHFRIWLQLTKIAFSNTLTSRLDSASYLIGKLVRFFFFVFFIQGIFSYTSSLAGYTKEEILLFFLTYSLVDVTAQALFRGIYTLKQDIRLGHLDFALVRPLNPLFYIMSKLTDLLDFIFLIPIIYLTTDTIQKIGDVTPEAVGLYVLFLCISIIIVLGIHILTAALSVRTVESDHIIWLYRECMTIGRFPPEIFSNKIQFVFTYIIPIVVAVGFPVKALLGEINFTFITTTLVVTVLFFVGSMLIWKHNLKFYSSASS